MKDPNAVPRSPAPPFPPAPEVLITGAGPTGLVLALWLTRLGGRVRIIDKTSEPGTTSRALAVQARTLEFYRQLGIAQDVVNAGVKIDHANLWVAGQHAAQLTFGEMGERLSPFPFPLIYPQDAHERLLIDQLAALGVDVERQTELLRFEQNAARVRALIRKPDGSDEWREFAYVAGCDGARSAVRDVLDIGFPGGTYSGVFFVADVVASGPAADRNIHVDIEEADFLAVFPLKARGHVRLIGLARPVSDVDQDTFTFDDLNQRAIQNMKLNVSAVNWFSTYRVHHRVADRFREGRVFLLGDAAHVHSPVGGQGMNTGIGDAVNLAWKLAAVLKGEAAERLLDTYEVERIGFARRLVATTDRAFTFVTRQGRVARWIRTRVAPRVAQRVFRAGPLRRRMFCAVSQIDISYRDSALSSGSAGDVHGGNRLPWVRTPNGDNFTALESMQWQVHIYGEASSSITKACAELMLPLHVFAWQEDFADPGLLESAVYLIRPDGYVALADASASATVLRDYWQNR